MPWSYGPVCVVGHLASKANSRRITFRGRHPRSIKSQAALDFADSFASQVKRPTTAFTGPVSLSAWVYYADRRRDLDISLLQDCIQAAGIIKNDRQIVAIHAQRYIDAARPRVVFELTEVTELTEPPLGRVMK